jgi:glycosyltransferase involved in cell wall biosynthesis
MATWNGAPTLPRVLEACCRLQAPEGGWSLLIVDDGCTDSTREVVAGFADRLPLRLVSQARRGKNAALNLALQLAHEDTALYVFLDDDTVPAPDWLLRFEQCAREQPGHSVFGGAIAAEWSEPPPPWVPGVVPLGATYAVGSAAAGPVAPGLVWGANMAVRRAVFEAGYRFDTAAGRDADTHAAGSAAELARRLAAAGYGAWFIPAAQVGRFIRRHQVSAGFILHRAWLAGRAARLEGPAPAGAPAMMAQLLRELRGAAGALVRRDFDALLRRRWEMAWLRGFLFQAWFGRRRRLTAGVRVLIACGAAEPQHIAARIAQEARLLAVAGCDCSVVTANFGGQQAFAQQLQADGVTATVYEPPRFLERPEWRRSRQLAARLAAVPRLRRCRHSLAHVVFCSPVDGAALLWLATHCKLPSVLSIHHAQPPARLAGWQVPLFAEAFGQVRGVYAVSTSAMAHFMVTYGRFVRPGVRLAVIPNSVDTARFLACPERRAGARARLGLAPRGLVIGALAPLEAELRPDALVDVFCALRNRFDDLQLLLAGAGTLEAPLRARVAALGLDAHVVFCGALAAPELLLPALDLQLLLGRIDAGGAAILEALACGVPVLAVDAPGGADILRASQAGLLVPAGDQRAVIDAAAALLHDRPRLAAMALAARAEAQDQFSPQLMQQRVRDFYAALVP